MIVQNNIKKWTTITGFDCFVLVFLLNQISTMDHPARKTKRKWEDLRQKVKKKKIRLPQILNVLSTTKTIGGRGPKSV